jgi:hypothetical protein
MPEPRPFTNERLRELLSHPDAHVRSLADWACEARRIGWRHAQGIPSYRIEDRLADRLAALERNSLVASPAYYLP